MPEIIVSQEAMKMLNEIVAETDESTGQLVDRMILEEWRAYGFGIAAPGFGIASPE